MKILGTTLNVLNCKEKVNSTKYREPSSKTTLLLKELYTLKKINLAHGKYIIEYRGFPIRELSEDAQKSVTKFYEIVLKISISKHT